MEADNELRSQFRRCVDGARRISTLSEFDDAVRTFSETWKSDTLFWPKIWFRGHNDSNWLLIPTALRPSVGPLDMSLEMSTFVEFKRRAIGLAIPPPRTHWGWLYLAQHNGLPTRLLDWTESSHIALFFALRRSPMDTSCLPTDPCVWMINPARLNELCWNFSNLVTVDDNDAAAKLLDPYLRGIPAKNEDGSVMQPLAVIPEYISPRLRAQRGGFIAFAEDGSALMRKIAEENASSATPSLACPILIDGSCGELLERELEVAGVGESTVFPDLVGLCAELSRRLYFNRV